jgi:hypothetical protein
LVVEQGESVERAFKMHNTSPFSLPYRLVFTGGKPHPNVGMLPAFYTKPAEVCLLAVFLGRSSEIIGSETLS